MPAPAPSLSTLPFSLKAAFGRESLGSAPVDCPGPPRDNYKLLYLLVNFFLLLPLSLLLALSLTVAFSVDDVVLFNPV